MRKYWIFLCICLPFLVSAQDSIQGKIGFYEQEMVIGQEIYLELEVKAIAGLEVNLPSEAPVIKGLEAYKTPIKVDPIQEDLKTTIYKIRYPYIAFDSVSGEIGTVAINYSDKETSSVLQVEGGEFQVNRIAVDTTDDMRSAYGPIAPAEERNWNLLFTVLLVCLVLAIFFGILQWRKKKEALFIPDNIDPRVWAIQQIAELENEVPYANPKKSWSHLSDILRLFLEREWNILAPYLSTGEILGAMAKQEKLNPQIETISEILNICDEVKFARRSTSEDEQKSALISAKEFVRYEVLPDKLPEKEVKDE